MTLYLISFLFLWQTAEIPFRAKEDFQVELKYDLKTRPAKDPNAVTFEGGRVSTNSSGALPYLTVNVTILNPKVEEIRFRCENNLGKSVFNKKADRTLRYVIDMGYIDDLKDHVSPHGYTLFAIADDRVSLNKIEFLVMEDGTFMVNGEKRGKF
ncbi:MAG TPA: hypothetical protein VK508_04775 [Cyclobacteriaceae bacterium]|nr:hypothetical protein [Cyclobacteriaceae bacterium]